MNVKNVQQPNEPIICIPRVIGTITKMQVASIFKRLGWGKIDNIIIVTNGSGKTKYNGKRSSKWGFSDTNNGSSSDMQWRNNNKVASSVVEQSNCIFVHLNWYNNDNAISIREKLLNKESIKLVCGEFEFWKLYAKNKTIK